MVLSNDEQVYMNARAYHDHGHEYSTDIGRGEEVALCRGFNYRMTEIHAVIGLVQLNKLDSIVDSQRANKLKLMEGLKDINLTFRRSLDSSGDIGDTIVFFLPDRERTAAFIAAMSEKGLGTKNLPDAIRWHFAKYWGHMLDDHPLYGNNVSTSWSDSAEILECSIALPVTVKMSDDRIEHTIETLHSIAKNTL
jgi:8-amino-3,8-dideoxy-alpha-D-manno-octulosonate transaminase